jgi:DNA-binding winged helix-turn-helix (wHTH) protein
MLFCTEPQGALRWAVNQTSKPLRLRVRAMTTEPIGTFITTYDGNAVPLTYRFGPYVIDANRRMLYSGLEARTLPEKLFQVLLLLLEAAGSVVEKSAFFARIWPHDPSDANLTQHIFLLRGLLGETSRDHSYVVTVPGKGYRLAAVVERKVGLAMKSTCESCGTTLDADGNAYICSYECTFCAHCFAGGSGHCPNCGGEQVPRPRRLRPNSSTHRAHSD